MKRLLHALKRWIQLYFVDWIVGWIIVFVTVRLHRDFGQPAFVFMFIVTLTLATAFQISVTNSFVRAYPLDPSMRNHFQAYTCKVVTETIMLTGDSRKGQYLAGEQKNGKFKNTISWLGFIVISWWLGSILSQGYRFGKSGETPGFQQRTWAASSVFGLRYAFVYVVLIAAGGGKVGVW